MYAAMLTVVRNHPNCVVRPDQRYIPRPGETVADLEATATTAVVEELLVVKNVSNVHWENVKFEFGSWLGASGPKGMIDTQSAYLCQDGEPPSNINITGSSNVTFAGCTFQHLGGVYAVGAYMGSQDVIVSNSTFTDISGGGIKLGSAGERGAPAPSMTLDPALQDRGFLVSDNTFESIPTEYSGANPVFAAYVADTQLIHNSINNTRYSGMCIGWVRADVAQHSYSQTRTCAHRGIHLYAFATIAVSSPPPPNVFYSLTFTPSRLLLLVYVV